jgi:hypothetical protein
VGRRMKAQKTINPSLKQYVDLLTKIINWFIKIFNVIAA